VPSAEVLEMSVLSNMNLSNPKDSTIPLLKAVDTLLKSLDSFNQGMSEIAAEISAFTEATSIGSPRSVSNLARCGGQH
jgi:hypothetical protein